MLVSQILTNSDWQ